MTVDLNSDLGEGTGYDDEILSLVSSANIACGFHAGTPESILHSITAAKQRNVAIGAHPSLDDRANFGRTEIQIPAAQLSSLITYQLGAFSALCRAAGARLSHVKPHGALYNMSARDEALASGIARAIAGFDRSLIIFAPTGSALAAASRACGLQVVAEVFADRNYNADGSLVSRTRPDALLHGATEAAERAIRMLREGKVRTVDGTDLALTAETICVHGDTPGAVEYVRTLRERLEEEGIVIAPPPGR
ncbi:MAG: LamB/YcsF family protein [Verrucomicrobia bacterium]|nr:LamB/YcsF family protein [Verrucomicrobiota bacterium]